MEKPHFTAPPTRLLAAVPQFAVQDVVRTAEYYRDVLGFHIVSYWDGERRTLTQTSPPPFGIVQRDDVQLFFYRTSGRIERDDGGYDAYFHVKGVDALGQEWRSRGANIRDGPEDMVYGQREIVIQDPNGLILAFGEARSDAPRNETTGQTNVRVRIVPEKTPMGGYSELQARTRQRPAKALPGDGDFILPRRAG